jgi:hypothetical protein
VLLWSLPNGSIPIAAMGRAGLNSSRTRGGKVEDEQGLHAVATNAPEASVTAPSAKATFAEVCSTVKLG